MNIVQKVVVFLLIVTMVAGLIFSQKDIYERRILQVSHDRILLLPRKEVIQIMSLGYDRAVADILWVRAIQFFVAKFAR